MGIAGNHRRLMAIFVIAAVVIGAGAANYWREQRIAHQKTVSQTESFDPDNVVKNSVASKSKDIDPTKALYDSTANITTTEQFEKKFSSDKRESALLPLLKRLVDHDKNYKTALDFTAYGEKNYSKTIATTIDFNVWAYLAAKGTNSTTLMGHYKQRTEDILKAQGLLDKNQTLSDNYFTGGN